MKSRQILVNIVVAACLVSQHTSAKAADQVANPAQDTPATKLSALVQNNLRPVRTAIIEYSRDVASLSGSEKWKPSSIGRIAIDFESRSHRYETIERIQDRANCYDLRIESPTLSFRAIAYPPSENGASLPNKIGPVLGPWEILVSPPASKFFLPLPLGDQLQQSLGSSSLKKELASLLASAESSPEKALEIWLRDEAFEVVIDQITGLPSAVYGISELKAGQRPTRGESILFSGWQKSGGRWLPQEIVHEVPPTPANPGERSRYRIDVSRSRLDVPLSPKLFQKPSFPTGSAVRDRIKGITYTHAGSGGVEDLPAIFDQIEASILATPAEQQPDDPRMVSPPN